MKEVEKTENSTIVHDNSTKEKIDNQEKSKEAKENNEINVGGILGLGAVFGNPKERIQFGRIFEPPSENHKQKVKKLREIELEKEFLRKQREKNGPNLFDNSIEDLLGKETNQELDTSTERKEFKEMVKSIQDERKYRISNGNQYLKKIPPNQLLNLVDNEFIKVKVITFNMAGKFVSDQELHSKLFSVDIQHIYVIGAQECCKTIKKSFINSSKDVWDQMIQKCLTQRYTKLSSCTLVGTHLSIFVRKELKRYITKVDVFSVPCGLYNFFGDKGANCISFKFGRSSFLFINAHMTNKDYNAPKRNADYHFILENIRLRYLEENKKKKKTIKSILLKIGNSNQETERKRTDIIKSRELKKKKKKKKTIFRLFDHIFFFGDLNYRVNGIRPLAAKLIELDMIDVLRFNDQLEIAKRRGLAFTEFLEPEIKFLPSYKFDEGTDIYETGKKQHVPAWTDRIFYQTKSKIIPLEYDADFSIMYSDHRPVFCRFLCSVDVTQKSPPPPDEVYDDSKKVKKERNKKNICKYI